MNVVPKFFESLCIGRGFLFFIISSRNTLIPFSVRRGQLEADSLILCYGVNNLKEVLHPRIT